MGQFAGFTSVQLQKPKTSMFDLTHDKRLSTRMGRLTPVLCVEAIPGDNFRGSSEILLRLAPMQAPIYDQIELYVHYFFVPNRLLWEDWEEFITGGRLGVGIDPIDAPIPPGCDIGPVLAVTPELLAKSSLSDYLGVPVLPVIGDVAADYDGIILDVMPHLAYQLTWKEYYRDRNYVADTFPIEFPVASGQGYDLNGIGDIRIRDYRKDYFTSALPFTQRGVEVLMPLEGSGSVTYLDTALAVGATVDAGGVLGTPLEFGNSPAIDTRTIREGVTDGTVGIHNIDEVLLTSSNVSINDFRSAYALQVWYERNAVGGSRYTESIQAHFAVKPQDSRLQRPEYLGGGRIPVKISEVLTTAFSSDGTNVIPAANMQGHGVTYGNTNRFSYYCQEHGFIMGIASIMNPPSYHQGLPRMFRRRSFLDYPWPTFAKLGEQIVEKAELFASGANLTEEADGTLPLFGYQSRYADWKFIPNTNHGEFHDTLLFWTLTREFATSPELGSEFVNFDSTTQDRIFIVDGEGDNFWLYCHNKLSVVRALPYFGMPNTLGFS